MRPRRRLRDGGGGWVLAASCAYAALIPLQPVLTLPDGSPLRFAAADAVAPLVFLGALVSPRRRLPSGVALTAVAIPLLALFETLWAARERDLSQYALGKTAGLVYLVAFCLALGRALPRGGGAAVLRALARGAVWSAVVGLAAFTAALRGVDTPLVSTGRLCSTMLGDPNIYCSLLAVGLLATVADTRWSVRGRVVRSIVLGLAILATGSRSGLAGVGVGCVVWAVLRSRNVWMTGARSLYACAAAAVAALVVLSSEPGARAAAVLWEHTWRTATVESRFALYARAFEQFADHPLTGLGIGGFNDINTWEIVHNTYLWALVDLGVGGGVLVAALVAAGIAAGARAARGTEARAEAAAVAAGLSTLAVFNLFVDGFYQRHFWLLLGCAVALPGRPRRAVTRAAASGYAAFAPTVAR